MLKKKMTTVSFSNLAQPAKLVTINSVDRHTNSMVISNERTKIVMQKKENFIVKC